MDLTSLVVLKYSVLTVLGQAIALALIVSLLLEWKKKKRYAIVEWCSLITRADVSRQLMCFALPS
jgi:hypothetical protein